MARIMTTAQDACATYCRVVIDADTKSQATVLQLVATSSPTIFGSLANPTEVRFIPTDLVELQAEPNRAPDASRD